MLAHLGVRYLAVPATLLLTAVTYGALLPWGPALAFVAGCTVMAVLLSGCEQLAPLEAFDETPHQRRTDMAFSVATALLLLCAHPLLAALPAWEGHPLPLLAQVAVGWAAHDLVLYAWHRLLHESGVPWLWRLHEPHHTPTRFTFMAGSRSHLAEIVVTIIALCVARLVFGLSDAAMHWVLLFPVASGAVHHTNADFRLGWFNYVFPGPEMHRAHHDRDPRVALNYATSFPLWDVLFGTDAGLRGGAETDFGVDGRSDLETTWVSAHLAPFRPVEGR